MNGVPRVAMALYVALAAHAILLFLVVIGREPQDPAGPGRGLDVLSAADVRVQALAGSLSRPASAEAVAVRAAAHDRSGPASVPDRADGSRGSAVSAANLGGGGHDHYFALLRQHLANHRRAVPVEVQGAQTLIGFRLQADGGISGLRVARSSGHTQLDEEALEMVRRALPLPRPPPALVGAVLVPLRTSGGAGETVR